MDPALRHDVIVALPGLLATIGAWFNAHNTRTLKLHINSRMDQLLEAQAKAAEAKGRAAGVESERTRQNDRRVAP